MSLFCKNCVEKQKKWLKVGKNVCVYPLALDFPISLIKIITEFIHLNLDALRWIWDLYWLVRCYTVLIWTSRIRNWMNRWKQISRIVKFESFQIITLPIFTYKPPASFSHWFWYCFWLCWNRKLKVDKKKYGFEDLIKTH